MSSSSEDPVLVSARREALVVLAAWLIAMTYSVGYCYQYGYGRPLEDLKLVWGFPDWIFWGVVMPWAACVGFSFFFGAMFMHDQDLGMDAGETEDFDRQVAAESEHHHD